MDERGYVAQALFTRLSERNFEFCLLGDVRSYPEAIPSDVDLAVHRGDFEQMPRTISQFCRDLGLRLVQLIRYERTACYFVIAWHDDIGRLRYLAPDICSDYCRGGRLLLTAETLLSRRQPAADAVEAPGSFMVPAPDVQFVYFLTKKIDKQELNDVHGEYLSRQWHADPDAALRRMVRFWPELPDSGLIARAAASNRWDDVQAELPGLRSALHRSTRLSIFDVLPEAGRLLRRALQPTGMTIAFAGADGSGKSSAAERAVADLAPAFRRSRVFHLRPRLFGADRAGAATTPYQAPRRRAAASLAKLAFLVADYFVGYALVLRPLATRTGLVVFDRYFHDLIADPRRHRYGASLDIARAAAYMVPAPDVWLVLDAPAHVLQSRKQEVSAEESEEQRRAYLALAARLDDAVVIDASRNLEEVAADVDQAVIAWLERRVERRYGDARSDNPVGARVLQFFCRHEVPLLSRLVRLLFNSDICCRVRSPILMPHPYGIVIHSKTVIGSRVTVMQQVTIGGKSLGENLAPVIERDVYIGAGAKILGAVRIGRGAVVGANAVVTRDVPSYCTVVGANRILHKQSESWSDDEAEAAAEGEPPARAAAEPAGQER
jgi:serine acetyltransferase/thymidylate kinase